MNIMFKGTLDAILEEMIDFLSQAQAIARADAARVARLAVSEEPKAKSKKKKVEPAVKIPTSNSRRRTSAPAVEAAPITQTPAGLTDKDVSRAASAAAAIIDVAKVKEIMQEFDVNNVADLDVQQRVEFVKRLKEAQKNV